MNYPVRIRLSRAKGFNLQAHSQQTNGLPAVVVSRPGPFGNPFVVGKDGTRDECVHLYELMLAGYLAVALPPSIDEQHEARSRVAARLDELKGKNLACWCALDGKRCHADVLLELANA